MKRELAVACATIGLVFGCTPKPPAPQQTTKITPPATQQAVVENPSTKPAQKVVQPPAKEPLAAVVNGTPITMRQLEQPLIEAYGLNILLNMVQLELAKQDAAAKKIMVTPQDIKAEEELTIAKMFENSNKKLQEELDDAERAGQKAKAEQIRKEMLQANEQMLGQFLTQQHLTRSEFDLVMQTNAYLRKIAEPAIEAGITESALQEGFRALYGETVQVRHIQCSNMQEIGEAQRRLNAGEPFDKVARELSRNARTAALGGELPPFSRAMQNMPEAFKQAAFALKEGEVSDPVLTEGSYHLIKLEHRYPPRAVKYEDHRESIRKQLYDNMMQKAIAELRQRLAALAMQTMKIEEPTLSKQFNDMVEKRNAEIRDQKRIQEEMEKDRQRMNTPATRPALPTTRPAGK